MAVIENSVEIRRPPEVVFDYCVDMRNELEWNPDMETVEKLTEGPVGVGTRFRAKWKHSKAIETECTRYDRPHAWRYTNSGPLSIVFDGAVQPTADGSTLAVRFDARPHGIMRLFFPILLQVLRRNEARNMRRIKDALEQDQGPQDRL